MSNRQQLPLQDNEARVDDGMIGNQTDIQRFIRDEKLIPGISDLILTQNFDPHYKIKLIYLHQKLGVRQQKILSDMSIHTGVKNYLESIDLKKFRAKVEFLQMLDIYSLNLELDAGDNKNTELFLESLMIGQYISIILGKTNSNFSIVLCLFVLMIHVVDLVVKLAGLHKLDKWAGVEPNCDSNEAGVTCLEIVGKSYQIIEVASTSSIILFVLFIYQCFSQIIQILTIYKKIYILEIPRLFAFRLFKFFINNIHIICFISAIVNLSVTHWSKTPKIYLNYKTFSFYVKEIEICEIKNITSDFILEEFIDVSGYLAMAIFLINSAITMIQYK